MKNFTRLVLALFISGLTCCSPSKFYQVYNATPGSKIKKEQNGLVYEDQHCKITYNLWGEGGNIGFGIYNKTSQILYLNTDESFFVLNGVAHDYYQNRVISSASSMRSSQSTTLSGLGFYNLFLSGTERLSTFDSNSLAYKEKKQVAVPPKTTKFIAEYVIATSLYRDCDLYRFPRRKETSSTSFSAADSPLKFSNLLTYTVGATGEPVHIKNEFYVSTITNYPARAFLEKEKDHFCGETSSEQIQVFKESGADQFYVEYSKALSNSFKH